MLGRAWHLYRENFGQLMRLNLIQALLRLAVLAPCLALAAPEIRFLALTTPVLFLLLVIPARQAVSEALLALSRGGEAVTPALLPGGREYARLLRQGLRTALSLLLWGLPLCAGLTAGYLYWSRHQDGLEVLRAIMDLGGGDMVNGVKMLALILLGLVLVLLLGAALHSCDRHARAAFGSRKPLRGHWGGVLGAWCAGLLTLLPFAAITAAQLFPFLSGLAGAVHQFRKSMTFAMPSLSLNYVLLAVSFAAVLLPAIPLKALVSACWTWALQREKA